MPQEQTRPESQGANKETANAGDARASSEEGESENKTCVSEITKTTGQVDLHLANGYPEEDSRRNSRGYLDTHDTSTTRDQMHT